MPTRPTQRTLVLQLGRLGDAVATRLALHSFARHLPGAAIELVVRREYVDLFAGEPAAAVHGYPLTGGWRSALAVAGLARSLRRPAVDLIVDVTGSPRARWLALAVGARHRAGWGRSEGGPRRYHLGTADRRQRCQNYSLEIARLLESLGVAPLIDLPPLIAPRIPGELAAILGGLPSGPRVVLHPGAANPLRRWRGRRFAETAHQLADRGCSVLAVAGPGEERELAELRAAAPRRVATYLPPGAGELASALQAADLFIGLDSGPLHLAAALGIPAVALFGPNVPNRARPLGEPVVCLGVDLDCRPCTQAVTACVLPDWNCMDRIEVAQVIEAAMELLRSRAPAAAAETAKGLGPPATRVKT